MDRQHNELLELVNAMRRDLSHSNSLCEKLAEDNTNLRAEQANLKHELATSRQEVATLRAELADHKRESAAAIKAAVKKAVDEQKAVTKGLRVDLDDLEQYGRRKSIRIQNVPVVAGERDDKNQDLLLESINLTLEHSGITLQHDDIVRFHRSSAEKDDTDNPGAKVSQVIVKFRNWRLRRQFQGLNKILREKEEALGIKTCRVYHDLTKRRLALLNDARAKCKNGWYAYADGNSNLKLRNGEKFLNFNTTEELDAHVATM